MSYSTPLVGDIVHLIPIQHGDTDALLSLWAQDEDVRQRWPRWSASDINDLLTDDDGSAGWWIAVEDKRIGFIQCYEERDPEYRHAGMDLFIVAAGRGRGVGTDAVRTLSRHLFTEVGHHRLVIDPATDNPAAIRTYEKVGFKPVGVLRAYELGSDGTWHDNLLMDMLAGELA